MRRLVVAVVVLALASAVVVFATGSEQEAPSPTRPVTQAPSPEPSPLVDPSEITAVLPPDAIPAIDRPRFLSISRADFLAPQEPVLAMEMGEEAKAYPLRILMWHEIVNDEIGGMPVAVTYCPLCNTGIAFRRPEVDGELLDFGTSGRLYHSNLVMYDRQTESLWPQATGQAVIGPLTGRQLEFLPIQIVAWDDFREGHPDGSVLSTATGVARDYGENPYVNYDDAEQPFLFEGTPDGRLPAKARVLGVTVGDARVAFPYAALRDRAAGDWSAVHERVGGEAVVVLWKQGAVSALDAPAIPDSDAVGAVGAFRPRADGRRLHLEARADGVFDRETGTRWNILGEGVEGPLAGSMLEPVIATDSYWFDWAAFFPSTRVFG